MWDWIVRLFGGASKIAGHEDRIVALEARANDHENRIKFLEMYREFYAKTLAMIHDLQAIQPNQAIRLAHLTQAVESGLLPPLHRLELMAPDEKDRAAVVSLRKQVKTNLTRAQKKVSA